MKGSRPNQAELTKNNDLSKTKKTQEVIESMVDGLNDHRIEDIGEFFSKNFRWMGNFGCGTKSGLEEFQDNWQKPFQKPSQIKSVLMKLACLWVNGLLHLEGKKQFIQENSWEFNQLEKKVEIRYMDFWKVSEGKIQDNWVMVDFPFVLKQLGVDVFDGMGWEKFDNK